MLLEDSGALIGLTFAFGGIVATTVTGNARFDAIGSMAIGLLLGTIAIFLGSEMRSLLVGESASTQRQADVREALATVDSINAIRRLDTLQIGPEDILVIADVQVDPTLTVDTAHQLARSAERHIEERVPTATRIVVRPIPPPNDE